MARLLLVGMTDARRPCFQALLMTTLRKALLRATLCKALLRATLRKALLRATLRVRFKYDSSARVYIYRLPTATCINWQSNMSRQARPLCPAERANDPECTCPGSTSKQRSTAHRNQKYRRKSDARRKRRDSQQQRRERQRSQERRDITAEQGEGPAHDTRECRRKRERWRRWSGDHRAGRLYILSATPNGVTFLAAAAAG